MPSNNYFDSTGNVFIKLYKKNETRYLYWETWNTDKNNATFHWGDLGSTGEQDIISESSFAYLKEKVNIIIASKIKDGYAEIPLKKQFTVSVIFKLTSWGTPEDLQRREVLRNILTEHLGWTGNGRCDDGEIGSGEMTLFADVIDPYLAIQTIQAEFKAREVKEKYYFSIYQGKKVIAEEIWPN